MDVVTDKLIGIPCNYQADEGCESDLIGEECDDENDYTINDRYNENCACAGVFTSDLNSNISEGDLIIYPNPVTQNQQITVEFFKISGSGQVNIINSLGQTIISETVGQDQNKVKINTSDLRSGMHWVSFLTNEKVYATKACLLYTSQSPRDQRGSRMPSSA